MPDGLVPICRTRDLHKCHGAVVDGLCSIARIELETNAAAYEQDRRARRLEVREAEANERRRAAALARDLRDPQRNTAEAKLRQGNPERAQEIAELRKANKENRAEEVWGDFVGWTIEQELEMTSIAFKRECGRPSREAVERRNRGALALYRWFHDRGWAERIRRAHDEKHHERDDDVAYWSRQAIADGLKLTRPELDQLLSLGAELLGRGPLKGRLGALDGRIFRVWTRH